METTSSTLTSLVAGLILTGSVAGMAGMPEPLYIGTSQVIVDELGHPLKGNSLDLPGDRDLVQVLYADTSVDPQGVIHPPAADGTPHPANPVYAPATAGIGNLTAPMQADPGVFAIALSENRPTGGSVIFVRVFNAPTGTAASFYGDSQRFTVAGDQPFNAVIAATDLPLDAADDDHDGVNNSWEETWAGTADYDGDGMTDIQEHHAGTDSADALDHLYLEQVLPTVPGRCELSWPAVPGKQYLVQCRAGGDANAPFINVSPLVTAAGDTAIVEIDQPVEATAMFRLEVVVP